MPKWNPRESKFSVRQEYILMAGKMKKNRYNCLKKYNFFNYLNQKEFYTVVLLNNFPFNNPLFRPDT